MKLQLVLGLIAALALGAWAQSEQKVAYVDIRKALQETQEGKKALADLATQFEPKKTELQNEQNQIQALQKQLQNGGDTLSADAKDNLTQTLQTKEQQFQRDMQDAQSDFQTAENAAAQSIFRKMLPVIQSYAQSHGYALVLNASPPQDPVLFAAQKIDITDDVVKLYNEQHPAATASAPAAKPAAPGTKSPPGL